MTRIVLDTDVVSQYRAGRLPGISALWRPIGTVTLNRRDFADFAEHDGLLLLDG